MNTENFHLSELNDFEVSKHQSSSETATSYYNSYLKFKEIVAELPKDELINRGWISSKDDLASLVPLYQSISSNNLKTLFRKSNTSNNALCSAWLASVTTTAKLMVSIGRINNFDGLNKNFLKEIAQLSPDVSIITKLPEILATKGIVLVYEKALPGMKLDGVVLKLVSNNPVIGISFRYPRIDHFWFTLLHELAHICIHLDQLDTPIFDDFESEEVETNELKANRLAKNSFVEKHAWRNCMAKYDTNPESVVEFANYIGIHPAIVAGMLQKETNKYNRYRKLTDEVDIRKMVFGDD
ncbi:ImmA/IrrE family metallo-endopeptidase [Thiovibrio frasassiensis]|uniref:ImmA/IrrE family metallo-endopeptidase n=1 Tax=Thiovibrio frasassiensis TaxID=2984131 RepID=A0A9X4MEU3_9BACT|nr:ImmA/IrrE family metallo-endopeptidase [Thiovibrio frasassiensis]MDG4475392.1 ImmA/IrrE family metallo-endopeptidase [Thiovibrio frasassiensis]